jgi:hypothetical protein
MPINTTMGDFRTEKRCTDAEQAGPCIVISQPMYFPWVGLLEQVRLCDIFVFYDDVQYSRGGFSNRVQLKTNMGIRWMTVPLQDQHLGQLINEVKINNRLDWRRSQRDQLHQAYAGAPYRDEMIGIVDEVFSHDYELLADLTKASMLALIDYFDLGRNKTFFNSSLLETPGASTQRVIDLCLRLQAKSYLTGHGARHYLEHARFEEHCIDVNYIDYGLKPYMQAHGEFTPYVTALDLVAYCGKGGLSFIAGVPITWRDFVSVQKA